MRTRDLKKLKPGQKLVTKLTKDSISYFPELKKWNNRIVYFDHMATEDELYGQFVVRSSHKARKSTTYEQLVASEVTVVNDLNTDILSLKFNGRR